MIKYLFVIFNSIALFFYSLFDNGGVSVTGNFPANVKPGTEVTAEVTIKKGSLGGFAKLQIDVPAGVTIKESESKGGNFSFTGTTGKWIWTGVPSDAEFTVKFIISADATVNGAKTITSKYSYVENNNKQVAEMAPVEVMFGEGGVAGNENKNPETNTTTSTPETNTSTPTSTVASNSQTTTPENNNSNNQEPVSPVSALRTITKGAVANEWNIEVKIKKDGIKGFARYSDDLPEGFTAKQGKTDGSSFSVADNKVKFVWVNVPNSEEINISYTLNGIEKPSTLLKGEYSYLENNQSKSYKLSPEKLPANSVAETPVNTNTTSTNENNPTNTNTVATNENPVNTNTTATNENNPTNTNTVATNENPVNTNTTSTNENNSNSTSSAISYGVQIGAFSNANVTNLTLGRLYSISEPIRSEMDNGLTKFVVGKFGEYKGARDHRENVKNKGVSGAFVTAYNGPRRISVQEALMIANQKWLK